MFDLSMIFAITGTFLVAGTVKGVIGLGLPTISLAILTVAFGLSEGMALLLVPSFVTNFWQAFAGRHTRVILRRLFPFLFSSSTICLKVWVMADIF